MGYLNANIADCLKRYLETHEKIIYMMEYLIDVIFDDPYLTEYKDSANSTLTIQKSYS